jgi:hypothetical protein
MPTPFPGMDPYLERPGLWNQVHADLIVSIRWFLIPLLRPRYHVAIEQMTYLSLLPPAERIVGIPDTLVISSEDQGSTTATAPAAAGGSPVAVELPMPEEVKHRYLEVRDVATGEVVTVIEILSPSNKIGREGREKYERKRLKTLGSLTNLVEIDLLRAGQPLPMKAPTRSDYRLVVSRSQQRPWADVYLFGVRDVIPEIPIPLRPHETEPVLPLNQILHDLYDQSGYDLVIDYQQPPDPPLSDEDAAWAEKLLSQS